MPAATAPGMSTSALAGTPYRENDASYLRHLRDQRLGAWRAEMALVAPQLIPLIVRRWSRAATALVAGLMCIPRDLLVLAGIHDWLSVEALAVLYAAPALLVPLVWWVTRVVVRGRLERQLGALATSSDDALADLARLDRHTPARWLAERAGRAERPASVAALVLPGLVPALIAAVLMLLSATDFIFFIFGVYAAGFAAMVAWLHPILLALALSYERRAEPGVVPLLVVLALVSLATTACLLGHLLLLAPLPALVVAAGALISRRRLRLRLADERSTIAALLGPR